VRSGARGADEHGDHAGTAPVAMTGGRGGRHASRAGAPATCAKLVAAPERACGAHAAASNSGTRSALTANSLGAAFDSIRIAASTAPAAAIAAST